MFCQAHLSVYYVYYCVARHFVIWAKRVAMEWGVVSRTACALVHSPRVLGKACKYDGLIACYSHFLIVWLYDNHRMDKIT